MPNKRQHLVVNGKPWEGPLGAIPGLTTRPTEAFGSRLGAIFSEDCPVTFSSRGRTTGSPRPLLVYGFVTPTDNRCLGAQQGLAYEQYYPGYSGQIFFDPVENAIMQVEIQTTGFPTAFDLSSVEERISWAFVTIGEGRHLLPVSAERLRVHRDTADLIKQEYKNHRHFESATSVTFN